MLTEYAKRKSELLNKAITDYQANIDALTAEKNAIVEKYKSLIEDETKVCTEFIKYYKDCQDRLRAEKKALKKIAGGKVEEEAAEPEEKVVDTLFPDNNAEPVAEKPAEDIIPDETPQTAVDESESVDSSEEISEETDEEAGWDDEPVESDEEGESENDGESEEEDELQEEETEDADDWPEVPQEW